MVFQRIDLCSRHAWQGINNLISQMLLLFMCSWLIQIYFAALFDSCKQQALCLAPQHLLAGTIELFLFCPKQANGRFGIQHALKPGILLKLKKKKKEVFNILCVFYAACKFLWECRLSTSEAKIHQYCLQTINPVSPYSILLYQHLNIYGTSRK